MQLPVYEDLEQDQDEEYEEYDDNEDNLKEEYNQTNKSTAQPPTTTNTNESRRALERNKTKQQIREGLVNDPQLENDRKNLYKVFGMDTAAGKELFNLYKCHKQPTIAYPKPKQKTKEQLQQETAKTKKSCPQQTQIQYPTVEKASKHTFYPVDFIPKRKPEAEIRKEIEKYYEGRKFYRPARGVDRKQLIAELQQIFKYKRGALPKGAELPEIDVKQQGIFLNDEETKTNAIKKTHKKYLHFTGLKPEEVSDSATLQSGDPILELNILFDQIIKEIEERQEFLQDIEELNEPKLKQKIKDEIIERVAELQKVSELKKQYA